MVDERKEASSGPPPSYWTLVSALLRHVNSAFNSSGPTEHSVYQPEGRDAAKGKKKNKEE